MKNLLVTGGAGYIGSHFVKKALKEDFRISVLDNLSRGSRQAVLNSANFYEGNISDAKLLKLILEKEDINAIVHFAAFAYVGESVSNPALYYENNVLGSYNLIKTAAESGIKNFIFSSTCSVYGNPLSIPISEDESPSPINPYANTKRIIEIMLADFESKYGMKFAALRYFNAAGSDPENEIGESHHPETHLIPLVLLTALGKRKSIKIFGNDYPTPDGTCIRDYIHVNDLADAHIRALLKLETSDKSLTINLGTGAGNSVQQIINFAKQITKADIPIIYASRRMGDPAILVADNKLAKELLGWKPKYGIEEIISHAWEWYKNPKY